MSDELIIRAWKDSSYRNSLSVEELSQLPAHPAGEPLTEKELEIVVGADDTSNALVCGITFPFLSSLGDNAC